VRNCCRGETIQRITTSARIAEPAFEQWLRFKNEKESCDIYIGMNTLKPEARTRTKEDIETIRHLYLDIDHDGPAALAKIQNSIHGGRQPRISMTLEEFVRAEWKPNAALTLKKSSMRIYGFQLDKHILPGLGTSSLRDVSRAQIEACLSKLKVKGHATSTLRSARATFSTVLQAGVERGYLEKNPAHGIRIREAGMKKERRFYSAMEMRKLVGVLAEPCRSVVSMAILTGLRIGEILALRWKRVDLLHGTIEVAETYSDGEFGTPKTRSSNRVIPISSILRAELEAQRARCKSIEPDKLVFRTPTGTPLDAKNLYNRELASARM
jgi:integrase